jgi:putative FmdB family regulatory protein
MPTYNYLCKCGHEFELFQAITSVSTAKCKKCGKSAKRVPGGGCGVIYRGKGFYTTDYKRGEHGSK